ncbi:MAG: L-aspartate oxidase [Acidimicrobiales bacterium]
MQSPSFDLLIIGSGVAGLTAAVRAANASDLSIAVLTKGELREGSTRWAQGGVAAVLDDEDSVEEHIADTLLAGAGLCDPDAVRVLVEDGTDRVNGLIELGAEFDRLSDGELSKAREGGHSRARIVHAGGAATGREIERALVEAAQATPITVLERWFAVDLLVEDGRCVGVVALDPEGHRNDVLATNTLLAAGGSGQLFAVTTNPVVSTGDGIAMAIRAGVPVADLEFMQFHPTGLHYPVMPRPLLSEAMRGHGALLRDIEGERFVDELQPRDIVARAMAHRMIDQQVEHLWLDATEMHDVHERFPNITAKLAEVGLDPLTDWLPIAPAAHYHCGGVMTDLDGATTVPGLWAAGEVTSAGVHGANRLASNSLLDGMVFAYRAVEAIRSGRRGAQPTGVARGLVDGSAHGEIALLPMPPVHARDHDGSAGDTSSSRFPPATAGTVADLRDQLQRSLSLRAGVLRTETSLAEAELHRLAIERLMPDADTPAAWELRNLVAVAGGLLQAAHARQETRGAHSREDFPDQRPDQLHRYVVGLAPTAALKEINS